MSTDDRLAALVAELATATSLLQALSQRQDALAEALSSLEGKLADVRKAVAPTSAEIPRSLEIVGAPLLEPALEKSGKDKAFDVRKATPQARYGMFQSIFYDSAAVANKQRIYLPFLDLELCRRHPFLDLGCGRGEFMRILREHDVVAVGVDASNFETARLAREGLAAVCADLYQFLERDQGTYSGAAMLQVIEHIPPEQIDPALELIFARLAPGAPVIIETVNPLSSFALAHFYTDLTHVLPLPPERIRYAAEAAGFVRTRTLFQSPVPPIAFGGPDLRSHYFDYAVIGYKP
jgi:SAM-dependent methyltransferase